MQVSRAELKQRAKEKVRYFRSDTIITTLVFLVLVGAIGGVVTMFGGVFAIFGDSFGALPGLLGLCATLLISSVLQYGYVVYTKNIATGRPQNLNDLFAGFRENYGSVVALNLLIMLFTFLWSLLFIIPGIIAKYRYSMAYYILIDNPDMTATQALEASKFMTQGRKADLFVLDLSFIGWNILVGLTFGILGLWIMPYYMTSVAEFYEYYKYSDLQRGGQSPFRM